jgi:hypothetical protein
MSGLTQMIDKEKLLKELREVYDVMRFLRSPDSQIAKEKIKKLIREIWDNLPCALSLKPCPFCGDTPHLLQSVEDKEEWGIRCENPDCDIEPSLKSYLAKIQAIAAWNTRHEDER